MKETNHVILNNVKVMFIAQIITWSASFVLIMLLPRYFGADEYGHLYFVISLTMLGAMVIDLGLGSFFVKEIARDKSKVNEFLMNGVCLRIITWLAVMAGLFIYIWMMGYSRETFILLFILGFGKLLEMIADLGHRIFQSFERLVYRSIAVVIQQVSLAIIAVVMILSGYGIVPIALAMTFSSLLNFLACFYFLPRLVNLKFRVQPSLWSGILRGGLPFLVASFFSFIYFRIDVIMLSSMASNRVVGWYGAPYKLFDTLMFFPSILFIVVFPVFSRLWKESKHEFVQSARRALDLTLIVGVFAGFSLIVLARPVIDFLFGLQQYAHSVILLQGLAFCIPLVYVDFVIGTVDTASDKQKEISVVAIIATVINIGLNFWLIPFFQTSYGNGAIGATIATTATEICVMAMSIYLLPKGCFGVENIFVAEKSIAAGIAAGIVLWYVESILHLWYISGVIGAVVYAALLIAAKVLTKREWEIVKSFLKVRRSAFSSQHVPADVMEK